VVWWLPNETTFNYINGREKAPKGEAWDKALAYWKTLVTDDGATFDKEYNFDAADIEPMITYGTNPGWDWYFKTYSFCTIDQSRSGQLDKSLGYMGFHEDDSMIGKKVDYVFWVVAQMVVSKTSALLHRL
jgi:3-isopropylmalate/(R)-2-methylmalate dehydratase large subunit